MVQKDQTVATLAVNIELIADLAITSVTSQSVDAFLRATVLVRLALVEFC